MRAHREEVVSRIERTAKALRASGACEQWLAGADVKVRRVVGEVNGPLMELLSESVGYHDGDVVELFRQGGSLFGPLKRSGNGQPIDHAVSCDRAELLQGLEERNRSLLEGLREDEHSGVLYQKVQKDVDLGRMSQARPVTEEDILTRVLSPRFCVEQGVPVTRVARSCGVC